MSDINKFKEFHIRNFKKRKPNYSTNEILFVLEYIQLNKAQTLLKKWNNLKQ